MTDLEVDDLLWRTLEPLLPPRKRSPKGGHPFADDRACLRGILFVLRTGRPWREVPPELGVSGVTCWRRLRDWQAAGAWARLHEAALGRLGRSGGLDWSRASLDSTSVRAKRGRRGRPIKLHADKAYDHAFCREACRGRGVLDRIARRKVDSSERIGRHRWVVERSFAWLRSMRRLGVRWERKAAHWLAFALLGCAVLCLRRLVRHLGL